MYVLVNDSYLVCTRMYSYVIGMYPYVPVCTRMLLICRRMVLVCIRVVFCHDPQWHTLVRPRRVLTLCPSCRYLSRLVSSRTLVFVEQNKTNVKLQRFDYLSPGGEGYSTNIWV